ncbi:hypothetical protein Emag_001477 [Eimeria magna]
MVSLRVAQQQQQQPQQPQQKPLQQQLLQQQQLLAAIGANFEERGPSAAEGENAGGGPPLGTPFHRRVGGGPVRLSPAERAAGRTCWSAIRSALSSRGAAAAAAAAAADQQPLAAALNVTSSCLKKSLDELQHREDQQQQLDPGEENEEGAFAGPRMYAVGMAVVLELLHTAADTAHLLQAEQQQQQLRQLLVLLQESALLSATPERVSLSLLQAIRVVLGLRLLRREDDSSSSSSSSSSNGHSSCSSGKTTLVGLSRGGFEILLRVTAEAARPATQVATRRLVLLLLNCLCEDLQTKETAAAATALAGLGSLVAAFIRAFKQQQQQQQQQQEPHGDDRSANRLLLLLQRVLPLVLGAMGCRLDNLAQQKQHRHQLKQQQEREELIRQKSRAEGLCLLLLQKGGKGGSKGGLPPARHLEAVAAILTDLLHQRQMALQQQLQQQDHQQQQGCGVSSLSIAAQLLPHLLSKKGVLQGSSSGDPRDVAAWCAAGSAAVSAVMLWASEGLLLQQPPDASALAATAAAAAGGGGEGAAPAPIAAANATDSAEEQLLAFMDRLSLETTPQQQQQEEQQQQPRDRMTVCLSLVQRFMSVLINLVGKAGDPTALSAAIRAAVSFFLLAVAAAAVIAAGAIAAAVAVAAVAAPVAAPADAVTAAATVSFDKRLAAQAQVTAVPLYSALVPFIMGLLHYRHKARWPEAFALTAQLLRAVEAAAFEEFLDSRLNPDLQRMSLSGGARVGELSRFVAAFLSLHRPVFNPLFEALWSLLLAAEGIELSQLEEAAGSNVAQKNVAFLKAKQHEIKIYKPQLEAAFGTAVRVFGCEEMVGSGSSPSGPRLSLAPAASPGVSFESFVQGSNVWLLPLLQRFVCRDDLGFFVKHILPAAAAVQQRAEEASAEGRAVESGDWYRVYRQLWGLLPAFCSQPLDMPLTLGRGAAVGGMGGDQTKESAPALIPRVLEFIHDSFLRETACAAIVALAKSAAPPGAETPQLQQQQQQHAAALEMKDAAKGPTSAADQHLLVLLRRLSDAAAAVGATDAPAAAAAEVRACAEAAARAARLCFQADNALVAAAVTAAATWQANTQALAAYAEETIGFLTVRYLLLHKETGAGAGAAAARAAEAAFAALSEPAKAKAAQQTLQAIQAFAPLCPRQLMEKNVKRFAGALLSSVSSSKPAPLAPKESAALLDVCDALRPFTAADIGAELFQVLLTLLRRCTAALDTDSSTSTSKILLRTLQRKAYGTLKHALDYPDSDVGFSITTAHLLEVWAVLKESRGTAAAAMDRKQRLGCLLAFLQCLLRRRSDFEGPKWSETLQDVLPASVPEVLLSLKDSNRRSRELAAAALESLGQLCEGTQVHLIALATLIAAGFGGITAETEGPQAMSGTPPFLKAAAALAMGRFFDLYSGEVPHSQVRQWAEVGLLLLKDHNRTVFNAGIYFAKACIRAGDMDDLAAWLPSMLAVLDNPNAAKGDLSLRSFQLISVV